MKRSILGPRTVTITGVVMVVVGALLIGGVAVAVGTGAPGPSLTVTPHARLAAGDDVVVTGTGFPHRSSGVIVECNPTPGEPALVISVFGRSRLLPVGCSSPANGRTTATGMLRPKTLPVEVGTLGTWETGTDSAGTGAAADSAAYPCPPTATQAALGVSCVFEFMDIKGQVATHTVTFKSSGSTTSTIAPTSTTIPTTTTTMPCAAQSVTANATSGQGTATVDPATCLVNGTVMSVTATGLTAAGASNFLGTVIECNNDPNQPTVSILGNAIPVSCTSALAHTFTPNAGGTASVSVDAVQGTTGPPCAPSLCGTDKDSSGGDPYTDAANYPCPPTAAELTAGDGCVVALGDTAGDKIEVPITFNGEIPPPPTCNAEPATATATAGTGSATVDPATCLVNDSLMNISATGLTPATADNYLGQFVECNSDPNQPTDSILGNPIPVSCSDYLKYVFTPDAAGTASMPNPSNVPDPLPAFSVVDGTTGPPCAPALCTGSTLTDSSGGNVYTDAANYPCPPTPAQVAAGDTCYVAVRDFGGDQIDVPIDFDPNVPPASARRHR